MKKIFAIVLISIFFGALSGAGSTYFLLDMQKPSQDDLIKDYYASEVAVSVSPHHIRKAMDSGDKSFILVDLRSQQEYEREHVIGAVSIPAYKDPDTSAYGDVERIVNSFKELKSENPNKEIIVYCYSIPCMTGRKVGNILAQNDVYVKALGIGWNEWRYDWESWNHEHEWDGTEVMEYIVTGPEPGEPILRDDVYSCGAEGELGC